jgi:hypothetical protein
MLGPHDPTVTCRRFSEGHGWVTVPAHFLASSFSEAGVLRYTISTIGTLATMVSPVVISPAAAQVRYQGALSAGAAFMVDVDDPDPSGSYSVTATLERRQPGAAISLGVEGGLHEYLILRQDLPPDVTGWSSKFEDTRKAWRVTPFVRWGTRGSGVRVYGQIGMGLYVEEFSNLNQQREGGVLVVDEQYAATDAGAGINLGVGLELFPISVPVGLTLGFRSHAVVSGGDWFNTGEVGVVYYWGSGPRTSARRRMRSTRRSTSLVPTHSTSGKRRNSIG